MWRLLLAVCATRSEGFDSCSAHTHRAEATIVEEILHRDLARQVAEERDTVVCAVISVGVTEGLEVFCEVEQVRHTLDAATSSRDRRRLRDGIDTDTLVTTVDVTEATSDRL